MRDFANGFWGTLDLWLQKVGRSVACAFSRRGRFVENAACAALGGSLLCAAFGAITGFALSDLSHRAASVPHAPAAVEGAIVGLLLGACVGVFFGSFVEAIDNYIRNILRALSPK